MVTIRHDDWRAKHRRTVRRRGSQELQGGRVDFDIVERRQTLVAGTVLRSPSLAIEGPRRARLEAVWHRTLQRRLPGSPATAYVDHAAELNTYLTQIAGYRCATVDDLEPGDVLAKIPAGTFARFRSSGDDLPDTVAELWRSIWDAESDGELVRSYTGDFERYPDANTVEVFVAVVKE